MLPRPTVLLAALLTAILGLVVVPAPSATAASSQTLSNTSTITIPELGPASPYPSVINVSGMPGATASIKVTLHGFQHTFAPDVDILLASPGGATLPLLSDVGGSGGAPVTFTIDDAAATGLDFDDVPVDGASYKPSDNDAGDEPDSWPGIGEYEPEDSTLEEAFRGVSPNGSWRLYVVDDAVGDEGAIEGGWTLEITTKLVQTVLPTGVPSFVVGTSFAATTSPSQSGNPAVVSSRSPEYCTVTPGTATVNLVAVGFCSLSFFIAGNDDYLPVQFGQSFSVVYTQVITYTSTPPSPAYVGSTYQVTAVGGGSGNPVVLTLAPGSAGVCTLAGSMVTFVGPGTCEVRANQFGNIDYLAAPQATQTFQIRSKQAQEVRITSKPTLMSTLGGRYQVIAHATSGLPVVLSIDPATTNGACTISGTEVTLVRSGICVIAGNQAGNVAWLPAPQATQSFQVTRAR